MTPSAVADLQQALGQYALYRLALAELQPDRPIYLAIPTEVYTGILDEPLGRLAVVGLNLRLVVFDPTTREVVQWIS